MSLFCPLYSGSSGNCFFLKAQSTSLLVDLGVSCRAATTAMKQLDAVPEELDGILITHEHSDHIKGLPVFLKKCRAPVYGSQQVLDYLADNLTLPAHTRLIPVEPGGFWVGEVGVTPFQTPHDSVGSLGYRLTLPDGQQVGFATDLGRYTSTVHQGLCGCDLVVLESNYDEGMILVSDYPYPLKRRIMSQRGHLSNGDCAQALLQLAGQGTGRFILGHLSQNNNMAPLAQQTALGALTAAGLVEGRDFTLQVASRSQMSQPTLL